MTSMSRSLRWALVLVLCPAPAAVAHAGPAAAVRQDAEPRGASVRKDSRGGPAAELSRAKLAYERGDYGAAIQLLRPLLYPAALLPDEEQVVLGHRLLGLCYFFEHDEAGAEQEFSLLLSLRPDFTLDPLLDPVKAVGFFDQIRHKNAERLAEFRRRQAAAEEQRKTEEEARRRQAEVLLRQQAPRVYIERVVQKQLGPVTFLPFGVPQLYHGRRLYGGLLLSGEAVLGGLSLSTWVAVRLKYPNNTFPPPELGTARALTATYLTTGALFWGLVVTGLIDALLHARTVVTVRELPGPPKEFREPAKPPKKPRPGVSLQLGPAALGGSF